MFGEGGGGGEGAPAPKLSFLSGAPCQVLMMYRQPNCSLIEHAIIVRSGPAKIRTIKGKTLPTLGSNEPPPPATCLKEKKQQRYGQLKGESHEICGLLRRVDQHKNQHKFYEVSICERKT